MISLDIMAHRKWAKWTEMNSEESVYHFGVPKRNKKNRKPCKQVNSWGRCIMMPCLSASFLTYKLPPLPPPQCTRWVVYCVATFWYYFSKGKPAARNKGARENTCYLQCCCHWEWPHSPWRSSRVCHRDRRPGDNTARHQWRESVSWYPHAEFFISSHFSTPDCLCESDKSGRRGRALPRSFR